MLVIASDVVRSVASEEPKLSGNSYFKLLAWTVADARAATIAIDKPLALTVGRRLDSRAGVVRQELSEAAEGYVEIAEELREGTSPTREEQLRLKLKKMRHQEPVVTKARNEVYVGFHELLSLLPDADVEPADLP